MVFREVTSVTEKLLRVVSKAKAWFLSESEHFLAYSEPRINTFEMFHNPLTHILPIQVLNWEENPFFVVAYIVIFKISRLQL